MQSRPETVKSSQFRKSGSVVEVYALKPDQKREALCTGRSVGARVGAGKVRVIMEAKARHALLDYPCTT